MTPSLPALPYAPPASVARPGRVITCAILGSLYFLPAALPFLFNASSFAVGTMASLVMFWLFYGMGWTQRRNTSTRDIGWVWAIGIAAFVLLHLVVASQIGTVDIARAVSSLAMLIFMIISATLVADTLFTADDRVLSQSMAIMALAFIAIGILSIAGIQPPTQSIGEKPIFPYTEPSFFALTFAPVIIYLCVSSPLWLRMIWLGIGLALALVLANLTLMISVLLAAIVSLPLPILIPAAAILASLATRLDLAYFTDRINFTTTSTNLSTLVYIQGWQLLDESLRNTMGWGLGFQQLGIGYTNVLASIRLNQLIGFDLNLTDGSFIFAKIGSEFGIFGIILSGYFLFRSVKSFVTLRMIPRNKTVMPKSVLLCNSILLGGTVEILVRGANYFTGSMVLFLAACFFLHEANKTDSGRSL